jgi:hypothetical protein
MSGRRVCRLFALCNASTFRDPDGQWRYLAVFGSLSRRAVPLLLLRRPVLRAPGWCRRLNGAGVAAVAVIMITDRGFLFILALHLRARLGHRARQPGRAFAPCAAGAGG